METLIKVIYEYENIEDALNESSVLTGIYHQNNVKIKYYQTVICENSYNLIFYLIKD